MPLSDPAMKYLEILGKDSREASPGTGDQSRRVGDFQSHPLLGLLGRLEALD